jgi:predicted ATPase
VPSEPFSKVLRRLRRAARLTQEELAATSGYSVDYISMLERGLRSPTQDTIDVLTKALGVEDPPPSDLLGRDADEERALEILQHARLLTLTGPGGVGKTSLARRIAARIGGATFVDLTPVTDLGAALADLSLGGQTLLVLDGFERFLDCSAEVTKLPPKLKILVTSRAPLRLQAEHELPVTPLDLAPATELFTRRARAIDPRFEPAPEHIAAICSRLDGLPLAIELAAARLRHLPLAALADQMKLGLLSGGARDLPVRHQRMHDTIAWSVDPLSPLEKMRLSQLSVFVGGFTLEAAGAVCEDSDPLGVIASLVDHSLVIVDRAEVRYRMLDTIREFAAELGAAPAARHAAYYTQFAEAAEAGLQGKDQPAWYRRVEAEEGNLRSAIEHAMTTGDVERAMRIAGSVWLFWQSHGDYQAGKWLEAALAHEADGATVPASIREKALFGAAWLAFRRGEMKRALDLRGELGTSADPIAQRNAATVAGHVAMAEGRNDDAIAAFEHGLALCRSVSGPSWHLAMSLLNLGLASLHARRLDDAKKHLTEAVDMHRAIGDEVFAARAIGYLGHVALALGELGRAEDLFETSTRAFEARGDEAGIAEGLAGLAAVRAAQGRDDEARQLADASEAIRTRSGWRPLPSDRAAWMRYCGS